MGRDWLGFPTLVWLNSLFHYITGEYVTDGVQLSRILLHTIQRIQQAKEQVLLSS